MRGSVFAAQGKMHKVISRIIAAAQCARKQKKLHKFVTSAKKKKRGSQSQSFDEK